MEESSEAHMETDVSSTTEDVPETQEVTGSNGNVEMVVIVEKVTEDEVNPIQDSGQQPPVVTTVGSTNIKTPTPYTSPLKTTINIAHSPSKDLEIQNSPTKQAQPPKTPSKETELEKTEEALLSTSQSEQTVDSSTIVESQKSLTDKSVTPTKTTPVKETQKTTQVSPIKVSPTKVSPTKVSPTKVSPTKLSVSPQKDICQEHSTTEEPLYPAVTEKNPSKVSQSSEAITASADNGIVSLNEVSETTSSEAPPKQDSKEDNPIEKPESEKSCINGDIQNSETNDSEKSLIEVVIIEKEASNDSQLLETNSDTSEKEHNKSISRELKSLIKSAKESKIISECTQLTSKTRKSRAPLDASNSSLNVSIEAENIQEKTGSSDNSQTSNCNDKIEKVAVKRSMRSQNPEFVNKVKQFLNSVTSKVQKEPDEGTDQESNSKTKESNKINHTDSVSASSLPKKKKIDENEVVEKSGKLRSDPYCWRCHWAVEQSVGEKTHPPMACTVCPRSYHYKCLSSAERSKINLEKSWVCPECMQILHAESSETRSQAMKKISLGMLCDLLKHALDLMMDLNGIEPFMNPVDRTLFPDYDKYVVHPMDLKLMKQNINDGIYGSTEAFQADAQWILHNSIIFNTCEQGFVQSKLTAAARTLVRYCRAEMGEIEACPECYAAAHARRPTWFTDVCSTPHMLLWAKLKGFPYWPAKGMSVNSSGLVDVRFFGAHDRAWVPSKDCFLYCEKDPNNFRTKRQDILDSMQEAEQHIRNISRKYGKFVYPPFKTQFDPSKLSEQLKMMIPSFEGEVRSQVKDKPANISPSMVKDKRSNSKSSKSSHNDGDTSDGEESTAVASRKMADGAEIAMEEDDSIAEKDKTMEVDQAKEETSKKKSMEVDQLKEETPKKKSMEVDHVKDETSGKKTMEVDQAKVETSRKRRRSQMEEAVFTIIECSNREKKKRVEGKNNKTEDVQTESQLPTSSVEDKALKNDEKPKQTSTPKSKDNEPTSTNGKEKQSPRVTPIRLVISTKANKSVIITKSNSVKGRVTPIRLKQTKIDKSLTIEKVNKDEKNIKRRNSKNKSLNTSSIINTSKSDKAPEKKTEKGSDTATNNKEKTKETETPKSKEEENKTVTEKAPVNSTADSPKPTKDRLQFDDDISLAVIARESKGVTNNNLTGMPTISSVRSLSKTAQNTNATQNKTIEITVEPNPESVVMAAAITNNVRNSKETANKVQKQKSVPEPSMVGKVGVRAFARMTSPPKTPPAQSKKNDSKKDGVQVEIKAEPIDLDDADRHMEKMDLMNAFRLKPVNPPASNLRDVRINKVVVTSVSSRSKPASKPTEARPRARKTFPQPKKADDGRSELNSKNSMVYIPIQPPTTPVPGRGVRLTPVTVTNTIATTTSITNTVNTATPPLIPSNMSPIFGSSSVAVVPSNTVPIPTVAQLPTIGPSVGPLANVGPVQPIGPVPTIGQVPTTVHTVPLITSVNGQWTFSLQPIMSVGAGIDEDSPSPIMNGLPEHAPASLMPLPANSSSSGPILIPASNTSVLTSTANVPPAAVFQTAVDSPATSLATLSAAPARSNVDNISSTSNPGENAILLMPASKTPATIPAFNNSVAPAAALQAAVGSPVTRLATLSAAPAKSNVDSISNTAKPGEPPRLQQRPLLNPLDPQTQLGAVPTPSSAGPLTAKLNYNAVKLTDFFRTLLEDSLEKIDDPSTTVTSLKLQLEQERWRHKQEIEELKHNQELTLAEVKTSFEKEKTRVVSEVRLAAQVDLEAAVKLAKSKQWCANCSQEAQFYCCWNTSYCDYPCQRAHWSQHFAVCTQQRSQDGTNSGEGPSGFPESRLQPQPDNIPKSTSTPHMTPALTVGGKMTVRPQETTAPPPAPSAKPSSIIMSMEKDTSGMQTLKCVGTYKAPPNTQQMSPMILNNQVDDGTAKKVVTSGGYLIVGATTSSQIATTPRRTHTIQYYT